MDNSGIVTNFGAVKAGVNNCSMVCNFLINMFSNACLADSDCQPKPQIPPFCCSWYMSFCAWTDQNLATAKAASAGNTVPFCSDQSCITISTSSGARQFTRSALHFFSPAAWAALTAALLSLLIY